MIVEIRFIAGRFHATAWGRHPNEAAPEWPPSPFRLVRALVDAWHRKCSSLPAAEVERVCAAISTPPSFWLPEARASHTRAFLPQHSEDPSDRKLVFDGFVAVDRDAPVLIGWPTVTLDPAAHQAARTLFDALGYLGRSESWVEARVVDDRDVVWNALPYSGGEVPAGQEVVNIAGVVPPAAFGAAAPIMVGKGKQAGALRWFDALAWGSTEMFANKMNRPPAMQPLLYTRWIDALDAAPPVRRARTRVAVHGALYAVDGNVRAPITHALEVAERIRRKLMGIHARRAGGPSRVSPSFSGKDTSGSPLRGHPHVSILPLDEDRDGWIDRILICGNRLLDDDETWALRTLDRVWQRDGRPDLYLTPIRVGALQQLLGSSRHFESVTPFVPTRHRHRKMAELAWLADDVRRECERRGLPAPRSVATMGAPVTSQRSARWLDFTRSRKGDAPRAGYGLTLQFDEEVRGPFSLGYASHFGLGCFRPAG